MKLLREFSRLCIAGLRAASGRRAALPRAFSVTVPAPLQGPTEGRAVLVELPRDRMSSPRREPASFLKAPRHRRMGSGR